MDKEPSVQILLETCCHNIRDIEDIVIKIEDWLQPVKNTEPVVSFAGAGDPRGQLRGLLNDMKNIHMRLYAIADALFYPGEDEE